MNPAQLAHELVSRFEDYEGINGLRFLNRLHNLLWLTTELEPTNLTEHWLKDLEQAINKELEGKGYTRNVADADTLSFESPSLRE